MIDGVSQIYVLAGGFAGLLSFFFIITGLYHSWFVRRQARIQNQILADIARSLKRK